MRALYMVERHHDALRSRNPSYGLAQNTALPLA
jgi:hypothetical protein